MSEEVVKIYTDGASRGNPGPGGYGVILMYGKHVKEMSGGFKRTTNNRMELMAVLEGIKALKKPEIPVIIYSDSKYVVDAISKGWLQNWVTTNFKGGKKNKDLWMEYYRIAKGFSITMQWVKGHADNPYNNRCDVLATSAADGNQLQKDIGFEENQIIQ